MEMSWGTGLKGVARVVAETSLFVVVVAQAICWLSGWSLYGLMGLHEETPAQSFVTQGGRAFSLSPAVKDMMKQVGIVHSTCYEKDRTSPNEFLICMGRADCAHAKKMGNTELVAAPDALQTPEGKRKLLEITHIVLSHAAKQVQTSDLKTIMEKIRSLGLACDNFHVT